VLDKVRKAEQMVRGADLAMRLLQANARIDARTFNLPSATLEGAERARRRGQETLEAHRAVVEAARGALQARLVAALAALQDPAIGGKVAADVRALAALEGVFGEVLVLRDRVATLATIAGHVESNPNVKELPARMMAMQPALHGSLMAVRSALSETPYPFEHATPGISVADFALAAVPEVSDLGGLHDAAQELVGNLYTLHRRLLARLATIAEQVETAAARG
jgi:hypothetical protein